MAGELLDVTKRAAAGGKRPGSTGDEGAPARVGGAAGEIELPIERAEPVDDAGGGHVSAPLGGDHRAVARPPLAGVEPLQGGAELPVHGDDPARASLGDGAGDGELVGDHAIARQHHAPAEAGDLAGTHAGFEAQEDEDAITYEMTLVAGIHQEAAHVGLLQRLSGLSGHGHVHGCG